MTSPHSDLNESRLKPFFPVLAVIWLLVFWSLFFTASLPNASNAQQTVNRLDVLSLLPEIYAGLLGAEKGQQADSSWANLGQRLNMLVVAGIILAGSLCVGRLILRGLKVCATLDRPTRLALAGGVGLSAVSLWTLGCGLAGWLSRPLFLSALLLALGFECWLTLRDQQRNSKTDECKQAPDGAPAPRWLRIGVLGVCIPFVVCMLLGALLPPTDFDVKEYHLGGPKEYFLLGRIQFLPHNVYTSFPFLTEMLSLAAMVLMGDWESGAVAGQAVLMGFAPLTAIGVFCVARRLAGAAAGWLAAFAYLTIPWTYRISIIAYTEGALCCYVVLSLLAFQIWMERESTSENQRSCWRELFVLGILAGSAVSTKYPGMVLVAIPFAAAIFISSICLQSRAFRRGAMALVTYGAGVLIAFGPWMLKNLFETGNPVYPLLYGVFGGADWDAEMHRKWQAAHPARLFSGGWDDFAGVIYRNDWQSPLLFGLAPLAFLLPHRRAISGVATYALVLLMSWFLFTHRIDRFWVPMNSVMAVLAGCGLAAILGLTGEASTVKSRQDRQGKKQRQTSISEMEGRRSLMVRSLTWTLVGLATVYNFGFITTPLCGYNAYLLDENAARQQTLTQSVAIIEHLDLPPGSKVLFVGEAELFNARFPYVYNTVFDKNLLEEWVGDLPDPQKNGSEDPPPTFEVNSVLSEFRRRGITHVFVNWNEILRYRTTYGYTDYVTPRRLDEMVDWGILAPLPLPTSISERPWESVSPSWQTEIDQMLPGLKITRGGKEWMLQYQLFRVGNPEDSAVH